MVRLLLWLVIGFLTLLVLARTRLRFNVKTSRGAFQSGEKVLITAGTWAGRTGWVVGTPAEAHEIQVELDTEQGRIVKVFPGDQIARAGRS